MGRPPQNSANQSEQGGARYLSAVGLGVLVIVGLARGAVEFVKFSPTLLCPQLSEVRLPVLSGVPPAARSRQKAVETPEVPTLTRFKSQC